MNASVHTFARETISRDSIAGKDVLEAGSRDVNGSLRPWIGTMAPARYVGTDIIAGPGVDEIIDIGSLADRFGEASFDVVICTEVVEHVRAWRSAISNLKRILRPGGLLLLTTRSRGFHRHAWPEDWWRYEVDDMQEIFADLEELRVQTDPQLPGVFVSGRRPASGEFRMVDTSAIKLYSMVAHRRRRDVGRIDMALDMIAHRVAKALLPEALKRMLKRKILREGE